MHIVNIATVLTVLLLIGVEFSISAFINPAARQLDPEPQLKLLSSSAVVLGRVMPFWYSGSLLLLGTETWLHRHTPDFRILLTATALWALVTVASVLFLVPLNNRIAKGAADWQQIHRLWDKRHRIRVVALIIAAILLAHATVR